jgi:hypothetical protein
MMEHTVPVQMPTNYRGGKFQQIAALFYGAITGKEAISEDMERACALVIRDRAEQHRLRAAREARKDARRARERAKKAREAAKACEAGPPITPPGGAKIGTDK